MTKNYIVSEIKGKNSYFRNSFKTAVCFLVLGSAVNLVHAQNSRAANYAAGIARINSNEQLNDAIAKKDASPVLQSKSSKKVALSGLYTIGAAGDYATLTAAVADFNSAPITGAVTFELLDATYTAETFPIVINANAGSSAANTLTVKPATGVNAVISGSGTAILKINGADYVTIDGSNNGTSSDNLTLNNTNGTAGDNPVVAWVASNATDGADHVTFKNVKFLGFNPSITVVSLVVSGPTLGGSGTIPNNYLTVESNVFNRAQNAVFAVGLATNPDLGAVITGNTVGSADPLEKMGYRGIAVQNASDFVISKNDIKGVTLASTATVSGILVGAAISNGVVTQNKVSDITNTNAGGYGANGIYTNAFVGSTNLLVSNNFVSEVTGNGYNLGGIGDNGNGIVVGNAGSGIKIYNNTVALSKNQVAAGRPSAINFLSTATTVGSIDVRNNIFVNNQTTTGQKYAIYSTAPKASFVNFDYNDYFTTGANIGFIGTTQVLDLASAQTNFGFNLNSKNVNPAFVSATDLHLTTTGNLQLDKTATPLAEVIVDFDGETRSATTPDIGADEFVATYTYNVGATGDYTSLTNVGGAFEALNSGTPAGNLVYNIIDDLTAETGTVPINAVAGGYNITIKPSGAARIISGTTASNALIRTSGASNITIDGSLSGGTDQSLSITNLATTAPQVVRFGSLTTPMVNNTLKNTIITNGANTSTAVVIASDTGTAGLFNNVTVSNNSIKKAYIGVYALSAIAAGNGSVNMSNNDLSTAGADAVTLAGLYAQGTDGAVIQNNTIGNFNTTPAYARRGVWIATGTVNSKISGNTISNLVAGSAAGNGAVGILVSSGNTGALLNTNNVIEGNTISGLTSGSTSIVAGIQISGTAAASTSGLSILRNKITNIKNTNAGGYAAIGMYFNGYSTAANGGVNIINNFISDVANYGYNATSYLDNGVGITFNGASTGYKIYNNSINMNTDQTIATGMTAAINVTSSITAAGAIDLRNNILVNSQTTTVNRYAIYSSAPATVFSNIDYNDYYSSGTNLGYLGSARATLANWQTATGKDLNSKNVNPSFISPTDLHMSSTNLAIDFLGTPLAEVTVDIDNDARSATTPDMGADEFTGALAVNGATKNSIKLYPNPVVDFVNINNPEKISSVEIYNVAGQKVASQKWNATSGTMDMRNLTPGMYIIKLNVGSDVQSVKVIKK